MAGPVTKFYVANIPEGFRPWDLASILKGFGDLSGAYIARKRSKDGLKFGFVSFKGVADWKEMENKLKGIKLGKNTLRINVAKFAKENEHFELGEEKHGAAIPRKGVAVPYGAEPGTARLSKDTVAEVRIDAGVVALASKHNRAVIARVLDYKSLISIKYLLSEAGFSKVDVQYVGGFNILLVFENDEMASVFCNREPEWKVWFSNLDVWIGQALVFEKIAWLRVHGIPLHLFCDEVVSSLCCRFGTVVKPPQIGEGDGDLSMAYVGVLVGDGKRVFEEVMLSWQDKRYRVWISEDLGDWMPDCLDPDRASVFSDDDDPFLGSDMISSELKVDQSVGREVGGLESEKTVNEQSVHGKDTSAHGNVQGINADIFSRHEGNNYGDIENIEKVGNGSQGLKKVHQVFSPVVQEKEKVGESGDHLLGFKLGSGPKVKRKGTRKPIMVAHARNNNGQPTSPTEIRPRKRHRSTEAAPFVYSLPSQNVEPVMPVEDVSSNKEDEAVFVPVNLNLNVRADSRSSSETLVEDSLARDSPAVQSDKEGGGMSVGGDPEEVAATVNVRAQLGVDLRNSADLVKSIFGYTGGAGKSDWVKGLVSRYGVKFLALQESKKDVVSSGVVAGYWVNSDFELDYVASVGQSGGLICLWDKAFFKQSGGTKDRNFLHIKGSIVGSGEVLNFVNVYAPQSVSAKKKYYGIILLR
ncbi:putative RNA recognition motif domain, nucleotide-binding alpha-beta plait domain superfamily [Helianthus annuus]|nr:putative RNA recognition motif domain, nucleotide-binding alpha-beta plait domain superfamily [Helianthus annuus]